MACKALGKKGAVVLGTTKEGLPRLHAENGWLYWFGYTHELAKSTLYRVSRAGGAVEPVASQKGVGEIVGLAFAAGAAYYVQHGSLYKLGPGAGAAVVVRKGASSPPAVFESSVFVVECDKQGPDKLLELPSAGGEAAVLAELSPSSSERCKYSSLVADAADVFIADWRGSRVVAVSRRDKTVRDVVTKKGFPSNLVLDGHDLVLLGALGLLRTPRAGGKVSKLLDQVVAPYSGFVLSQGEYWLVDQLAYEPKTSVMRMARDSTTPRAVATYRVADPVGEGAKGDSSVRDFAVDDQCLYTAEQYYPQQSVQLVARAK